MHCFACDILLDSPTPDGKTGRYYCSSCRAPTEDVIFYNSQKDLEKFLGNFSVDAPEIDEVIDSAPELEYTEYQIEEDSDE